VYVAASDAALSSAGGYRSFMGTPYTSSVLARKGGTSGFVDIVIDQPAVHDGTQLGLLATVAQGTTTQERIGRKLTWKSIQLRGSMNASSATTAKVDKVVMLLIYDKRPTGALPTLADVLEGTRGFDLNNENGFDRFKILKRMEWMIIGNTSGPTHLTANTAKNVKKYIKLNKPCAYGVDAAGVAGSIAGIKEGALYWALTGSHNTASGLGTDVYVAARVRFQDVLS